MADERKLYETVHDMEYIRGMYMELKFNKPIKLYGLCEDPEYVVTLGEIGIDLTGVVDFLAEKVSYPDPEDLSRVSFWCEGVRDKYMKSASKVNLNDVMDWKHMSFNVKIVKIDGTSWINDENTPCVEKIMEIKFFGDKIDVHVPEKLLKMAENNMITIDPNATYPNQ